MLVEMYLNFSVKVFPYCFCLVSLVTLSFLRAEAISRLTWNFRSPEPCFGTLIFTERSNSCLSINHLRVKIMSVF